MSKEIFDRVQVRQRIRIMNQDKRDVSLRLNTTTNGLFELLSKAELNLSPQRRIWEHICHLMTMSYGHVASWLKSPEFKLCEYCKTI